MRSLNRNKRKIYYAGRIGDDLIGDYGEVKPLYGKVKSCKVCVQYTSSSLSVRDFGKYGSYDAVLIADNYLPVFGVDTIFWIDNPETEQNDYVMASLPEKTLNGVAYRLRRVEVSGSE